MTLVAVIAPPEQLEAIEYVQAQQEIERTGTLSGSQPLSQIGASLLAEFTRAEIERRPTEERWLKDLRQYKGKYDPEVEVGIGNRSKAFVRKTRVKVKTIDSRVADLLFPAGSEKNWEISPTPKPNIDGRERDQLEAGLKQANGGQLPPGVLEEAIRESAKQASARMSNTIDDQLTECRYKEETLKVVHSCHLYGTGILKGPLVERKTRTRFKHEIVKDPKTGQDVARWTQFSESYVSPFVEHTPLWRFYPDMSATNLQQSRYAWELHKMPQHMFFELTTRPTFNAKAIMDHIRSNPGGCVAQVRNFDVELRSMGERDSVNLQNDGAFDVLERWGYLSGTSLRDAGCHVPEDRLAESFFANIWMLPNGTVIRAVLQPINGSTWPYHLYHFDKDETSFFGDGLSSIMRDDQEMLNAAVRLMLDNAAITAGPQLEVAVSLLASMEQVDEIVPWRIWKRKDNGTNNAPAVRAIELPSRINELTALAQMFEANADEVTAIPRYMSGENATQGAAGTAAGMSMLMGAANIVIKDLITSWDEGITRPFLQALYQWNMQFNEDSTIKGDFNVKARGTASLVAKEVRARQLNEFAAIASDPQDAPFIKRHKLLRARAEANELSDVVKTEDEVKAEQESEQAQKQRAMQEALAQAQVDEQIGKAKRMSAEAELAMKKVEEVMAKISLMGTQEMVAKVEAIYAALQAGGVATRDALIAPAADEILRSSNWKDATPTPSIAQLNGPPVQQQEATQVLLNNKQTIMADPRVQQPEPQPAGNAPTIARPTGMDGRRSGIETQEIESP